MTAALEVLNNAATSIPGVQTPARVATPVSVAELVATGRALLSCWIHGLPSDAGAMSNDIASQLQVSLGAIWDLLGQADDGQPASGFVRVMSARGLVWIAHEALWNICIGEAERGGVTVAELRSTACHARQLLGLAIDSLQAEATAQGGAA
jgi:hypothetical protein